MRKVPSQCSDMVPRGQAVLFVVVVAYSAVTTVSAIRNKMDKEDEEESGLVEGFFTGRHRAAMLFPLLLGISARLAALVPTFFLGVVGIFLFVAFSKKAFIVSLFALLLTYLDRYKNKRPKIIHVHSPHHHQPEIEFDSFHQHHHRPAIPPPPHKIFDYGKKSYRKWPKVDHDSWGMTTSGMGEFDAYVPQMGRRNGAYYLPYPLPMTFSPTSVYYPKLVVANSTETPLPLENTTISVTPELQQFLEKTLAEEDPR